MFSGGSLRGQNSLYPLAKHSLGAALGFGGFKWSRSDGGVAPVCHPYVSPRSFLACRTRLHTDVDNRVCVHFLLDSSFLFKLIIYLFPAVPSLCFVCGLPAGAAGRLPSSAVRRSGASLAAWLCRPQWLARWRRHPAAHRLFPGQGSNSHPPHRQEDPSPPATTEALMFFFLIAFFIVKHT